MIILLLPEESNLCESTIDHRLHTYYLRAADEGRVPTLEMRTVWLLTYQCARIPKRKTGSMFIFTSIEVIS